MSDSGSRATVTIKEMHVREGTGVAFNAGISRPTLVTLPSTKGSPRFVGRDLELQAVRSALERDGLVVVHGAPGLGKTRLSIEYGLKHAGDYPGGMFFVRLDRAPPLDLARLVRDLQLPEYPDEPIGERCRRALRWLGCLERALVIYDSVSDDTALKEWLPPERADRHVLVTSTFADWPRTWTTVPLTSLGDDAARALVGNILGDDDAVRQFGGRLIEKAGGVTIELCAAALAMEQRLRRGRKVDAVDALTDSTTTSFDAAWLLLGKRGRWLLRAACMFTSLRVPLTLVRDVLAPLRWKDSDVDDAVDEARARGLAFGRRDELEVHQLVARFVRGRESPDVASLWPALWAGLIRAAKAFFANPGDLDLRERLLAHPSSMPAWPDELARGDESACHVIGHALLEAGRFEDALGWLERAASILEQSNIHPGRALLGARLHEVGFCLSNIGRLDEAQRYFERAAEEKERGVDGRVDNESLSASLHQVGFLLLKRGKSPDAKAWFERAAIEGAKGDAEGRIDHTSLGTSLDQVGFCLALAHDFAGAKPWFERAVAEKRQGDTQGRLDHESLGRSLHQLAYCLARLGEYPEAKGWYEEAIQETSKGDVYGRIDHETLGKNIHELGDVFGRLNEHALAQAKYEQAFRTKEKGDLFGRVNNESLGRSLHQFANCVYELGSSGEAWDWYTRAAETKQRGDLHGRVDHESFGKTLHQLAELADQLGRHDEARRGYERALKEKELGDVYGQRDEESISRTRRALDNCE